MGEETREKEAFDVGSVMYETSTKLVALSQLFDQAVDDDATERQLDSVGKQGMSHLLQDIADEVTIISEKIEEKFKEGVYVT